MVVRPNRYPSVVRELLPYRSFFERGPVAQLGVRLDDGRIVEASYRAADWFDTSRDALVGSPLLQWVRRGEIQTCKSLVAPLIDNPPGVQRAASLLVEIPSAKKAVKAELAAELLDEGPEPYVLLSLWDVTESHQQIGRLTQDEERMRLALDATVEGFWDWNIATGEVFFSDQWLSNLGYSRGELAAHVSTWEQLIHPEDRAEAEKVLESRLRGDQPVAFGANRLRSKSGEYRWFADRGRVVQWSADGQPLRMVGTDTDITERKEAEQGRLRAEAELSRAEHLASVGVMAAGVAHEINNPLAYIINNLNFAISRLREDNLSADQVEALVEALSESLSGAQRVQGIVQDLNSFSRVPEDERTLIDVREPLESALGLAAKQLRDCATLSIKLEPTAPVLADHARLGQVFLNLLINAMQAVSSSTTKNKQISVRCRQEQVGDRAPEVVVEVQDTGVGITADNLRRIFDPFYTTKSVGEGTGLGLSICHNLVSTLGGTIEAQSSVDVGSTFTVRLPAVEGSIPAKVQSPAMPAAPSEVRKILVVDDDPLVARGIRRAFGANHEVISVGDGPTALAQLASTRFDAVLSDVMMPGMNGMELLEVIRERHPYLVSTFVFMTGGLYSSEQRDRLAQMDVPCLSKPFTIAEFHRVIREARAVCH